MAKKVIATLKKAGGREYTKVIKMVKDTANNAYTFKQAVVHNDKIKDWFAKDDSKPNEGESATKKDKQ